MADKPLDNKRAMVVGRSRAKVARRMAQMAATEDNEGQHGKARNNNISQEIATTSNKVLPAPLMDGGQGEMQNIDSVLEDRDNDRGAVGDGDDVEDGDARTADNNDNKEATDNEPSNLIIGILLPTKATRGPHPSKRSAPTNKRCSSPSK